MDVAILRCREYGSTDKHKKIELKLMFPSN